MALIIFRMYFILLSIFLHDATDADQNLNYLAMALNAVVNSDSPDDVTNEECDVTNCDILSDVGHATVDGSDVFGDTDAAKASPRRDCNDVTKSSHDVTIDESDGIIGTNASVEEHQIDMDMHDAVNIDDGKPNNAPHDVIRRKNDVICACTVCRICERLGQTARNPNDRPYAAHVRPQRLPSNAEPSNERAVAIDTVTMTLDDVMTCVVQPDVVKLISGHLRDMIGRKHANQNPS